MQKKTFHNVTLDCIMQHDDTIHDSDTHNGIISKCKDQFRFVESVTHHSYRRNPKLYDGTYCSLVHKQDGKYQIHMKTINASTLSDPIELALKVYEDILKAFKFII